MEDLGDQCNVVFALILLKSAGKYGDAQTSSLLQVVLCKDDFAPVSWFANRRPMVRLYRSSFPVGEVGNFTILLVQIISTCLRGA
jgi:hypothetical protein